MTTPARPGQFTGATDNAADGGLFTDTLIDGIPDIVGADVLAAETAAANAKISETNAATSETNAATSETNAAASATSATASANSATASATAAANSASTTAADAATATTKAAEASTSATNAAASQTAAANSATSAASSATSATGSANSATTSATASANSATASASSATASANSATAAATSETNAATSETNAATSATNSANSATASANSATASAGSASTATTQASNAATSATNSANSATASANSATAAAGSASTATTQATNAATSATAAANSATAAATSETNAANSAAAAAAAFDNFDDTYLGSKTSDPTVDNDGNALVSGALYFNSVANEMRVYDGANWIAASSAGTASILEYKYTATAGQTTFSGSDDASNTLSYAVDNLIVTLNGVVLENGTDYTATSGTSVVLASGATVSDELNVIAFKSFTTADMVSKTNGGTFAGNVTFADTKELRFGDDNDFSFEHNNATGENLLNLTAGPLEMHQAGTNSVLQVHNDGSNHNQLVQFYKGNSVHGNISTDTGKLIIDADGELELRDGGAAKLNTTSSGVSVTGQVIATKGSTGTLATFTDGVATNFTLKTDGSSVGTFGTEAGGTQLAFMVANNEKMRLDGSGNLLVSKTASGIANNGIELRANDDVLITKDGATALYLNRKSSDGEIIEFRKDGANAGEIGVVNGNNLIISNNADNSGLQFGSGSITPAYDGAGQNNAVDLGSSSTSFKDFYGAQYKGAGGHTGYMHFTGSHDIRFVTNGNERVRIDSNGVFKVPYVYNDTNGSAANVHIGSDGRFYRSTATAGYNAPWVNFRGTSSVSIRDSLLTSSVSDLGTGQYRHNFSTNCANNDFATACGGSRNEPEGSRTFIANIDNHGTGSYDITCYNDGSTKVDWVHNLHICQGDW